MKLFVAILAGLLLLTGCEAEQDPIKGAPEVIREGRPPDAQKPTPEPPLAKEALQIDAPNLVNGRVGAPLEFKILGRVMIPDVGFSITIDNLSEFPGATYDATTGDFKWTPAKSAVGSFPSLSMELRVTLVTEVSEKSPTVSAEKKAIALVIQNSYSKPIVNTVTAPPTPISIGNSYKFKVAMEDVDALSTGDVSMMVRDCEKSYYSTSIGHLVKLGKVKAGTTFGKYENEATVDLTKADYLEGARYCFAVSAVSKHGVSSDLYEVEFEAEGRMKNTKITLEKVPTLTLGDKMQIAFTIYDPSATGTLTMTRFDEISKILPGSSLTCNRSYATKYQLDCTGLIDTKAAVGGTEYALNFTVENAGAYRMAKSTTTHTLRIYVKAATP